MKKTLVMVGITGMLMTGMVTGCSQKEATAPTTVATEATTVAESSGEAETSAEAETETSAEAETSAEVAAASDDYFAWTAAEWTAASDEEKTNATKAYLIATVKLTAEAAGQPYTDEMEAAITDEMVSTNVSVLDMAFQADASMTLQNLMDMTAQAASAMVESSSAAQ